MPRFPSELAPHVVPYTRSITAPWSPLVPSQGHVDEHQTEHFGTSDNSTDWSPYGVNEGGWFSKIFGGLQEAEPLPDRPLIGPRPAIASAYTTPSRFWNLSGPGGFSNYNSWPIWRRAAEPPRTVFGFPKSGQMPWFGQFSSPGVVPPLPSNPPPQPQFGRSF